MMLPPGSFGRSQKFKETEKLLAVIETGLSSYQIDHGRFPRQIGPPRNGGAVLYSILVKEERRYLPVSKKHPSVKIVDGRLSLVDAWGNPIHYSSVGRIESYSEIKNLDYMNPTYDLWSTGGEGANGDRRKWISNWQAN